jgi:flagellar motor switch protein FliN/FliY
MSEEKMTPDTEGNTGTTTMESLSMEVAETAAATGNDALLDIELEARIQFGSREMLLSELMELSAGDVLELDRLISDPVDLLVGDRIVARGEVVVVGGNFGLQVTEVVAPKPRLESVRCLL